MKLIVTFADDEFFTFRDNTICLRVSNLNRLKDVINNSDLRQDFIDENGMLVLYLYEHSDDKRSPESPRFEFTEK